ncbi:MAG: ParB/RepB/Spo0J family partition protein [Planctomycetota bacterium]|jgi:ParB family chromosome partitioning protein
MAKQVPQTSRKPRLGRGLSSLIINSAPSEDDSTYAHVPTPNLRTAYTEPTGDEDGLKQLSIAVSDIGPNPYQPRREFNADQLAELTESIRRQGLLQPLVVCAAGDDPGDADKPYILIAGERRLRAARQAGHTTVPCILRAASREQMLEWALVENIQRSDLNPIERAEAYRLYIDRFSLTHAELAERLGHPRATVSNCMRILDLCDEVRLMLAKGALSFGHGKVLAGLVGNAEAQIALARKTVTDSLSVRVLEKLVSSARNGDLEQGQSTGRDKSSRMKPAYLVDLEERLTNAAGTRVKILPGRAKHSGRIVIEYYSLDDFDRIGAALGLSEKV